MYLPTLGAAKMPLVKAIREDPRAPIRWTADKQTVERILDYCEREYHKVKKSRYGMARQAILARIHGNLRNANPRAYNGQRPFGEISYESVARELTNNCADTEAGRAEKDGYLAALDLEWDTLAGYFQRTFIKAPID